jgi:hypothetical protein
MAVLDVIDALYCIPKNVTVAQPGNCVPYTQDLAPAMSTHGVSAAVVAPCLCHLCPHQWSCADQRTEEVRQIVRRNPGHLRGLASYDPLRIGESLRWIDDAIADGSICGAYAQAECCVSGLQAPRMYPLYGACDKFRVPLVVDFSSRERWLRHRPQVEVVAADFPALHIVLAPPPGTEAISILRMMERFPHLMLLLSPRDLADLALCEFVELAGRERTAFRAHPQEWAVSVPAAQQVPLSPAARKAYLFENAARIFKVPLNMTT